MKKAITLANWTEVNPREQNLKSKPAKEMRLTLAGDSRDIFHYLNRGISISSLDCSIKNIKDKKEIKLTLTNLNEHGVFDEGHSFKVLIDALDNARILETKHVMLEIFTGVEDILYDLARSRNTSTQVKEKPLANLEGKFDFVKEALKNECFFKNISWVENDDGDISINYLIQILTAFNKNLEHKSMPRTYSGAGSSERSFIKEFNNNKDDMKNNIYYKLTPLYSDIFKFVDHVLFSLPTIYNKNGYESEQGNFGNSRGITYKQDFHPLLFSPNNRRTSYKIPNAFFFPIIAAMRQLYKEDSNGMFEWIIDPITVFDAISEKLVTKVAGYYFKKMDLLMKWENN
ncbi:AIPR family protein [Bacillus cytotoxicus]|uniref:AIPR family protein n=1 Tax=Bacillus cytotoxicus TaxID=580165 RepID=UPI003D7DE726